MKAQASAEFSDQMLARWRWLFTEQSNIFQTGSNQLLLSRK